MNTNAIKKITQWEDDENVKSDDSDKEMKKNEISSSEENNDMAKKMKKLRYFIESSIYLKSLQKMQELRSQMMKWRLKANQKKELRMNQI